MVFLDDAPKREPGSDRLGHATFASRLASILQTLSAPDGYVIGLHGPWGSGKSSVLNFVCDELERRKKADGSGDDPVIVRFEPWIVSGHQDVTAAFMKVLAEQLPHGLEPGWKRWGKRFLGLAKSGSEDVIDAVAKIGVITDHTGGVASGAVGGLAKKAIGAAAERWLKEPSFQATYEQLVARLREYGHRYVVIVDDIDRLTADEIRDLMRMAKTVGKLPNVVYLLSYDRSVVWRALTIIDPDPRAGAFAEKIVQQEVDLPAPSRRSLLSMLSEALEFLDLDPEAADRRAELVDAGILRWIRQPRDVIRLSNGLRFAWSALRGELDPDDLVCMEGLRLNDRDLFDWIRDNRDQLIDRAMPFTDEEKSNVALKFQTEFKDTKARAGSLMSALFPNRAEIFQQKSLGASREIWSSVMTRRGIATQPGYDAYFSLHPMSSAIPKLLIDKAVESNNDSEILEDIITQAINRQDESNNSLIGSFLDELRSRQDRGAPASCELLVALLQKGNDITTAPWAGDLFSPRVQLHFLITDMLKRWDEVTRFQNLRVAYESNPPIASLAALHIDIGRAIGVLPSEGVAREGFVTASEFDELGALVMQLMSRERAAGTLDEQPVYYDIARVWALREGFVAPRDWLSAIALSGASRLARVASGLLGYSRTRKGRQFSLYSKPDLELYDIKALLKACDRYEDDPNLTVDEGARVRALSKGLKQLENGTGHDRDDDSDMNSAEATSGE